MLDQSAMSYSLLWELGWVGAWNLVFETLVIYFLKLVWWIAIWIQLLMNLKNGEPLEKLGE